jgi:type III pantothenate kinase
VLLAIDIGNTNVVLGIFSGDQLNFHWRLATDPEKMPDEYGLQLQGLLKNAGLNLGDIDGICLASVVPPLTDRVQQACQQYLTMDPVIIDHAMKFNITIGYEDPKAVGVDRICDAVCVQKRYGGPACIIDFGTATTFNALTGDGVYLGGAITAGLGIAADALYQRTSKLTRVDLHHPPAAIGRNTVHAMQSGLLFGYVALVEGMVARFRAELGEKMKVIATGGLAEKIASETQAIQITNPWLTLEGIQIVWSMNKP